ncbi:hypothetical protein SAMN05519104_7499 [Rhizobiales bacterium GAS188]|nr:hypothetical protein SAMN05519104_7499 [Rhizobiales bacterium GAS188]
MRHRDIDYDVKEDEPSKWGWTIYPKKESGAPVRSETFYKSRDAALFACIRAIDDGLSQSGENLLDSNRRHLRPHGSV